MHWAGAVVAAGTLIMAGACTGPAPAQQAPAGAAAPVAGGESVTIGASGGVPASPVPASAPLRERDASSPPTPLPPMVAPLAPEMPALTLGPRPELDASSAAAATVVAATAVAQASNAAATAAARPSQEIRIEDLAFLPAQVTVKPGTLIIWRNADAVMHQVQGGAFDSGRIAAGTYWAATFEQPGRYSFVCSFHPTMRAEIDVSPDDSRPLHLGS